MSTPELKLNMNAFGSTIGGATGSSLGNNPFGSAGTSFINSIFSGGNFWDSLGQSAANMGMQAASMAMSSVFSAVGGAFTSGISLATEKAKNKASEVKIAKENKASEKAAQDGAAEAERLISEANSKVSEYNVQLSELQQIVEESQQIITAKKEEMLANIEQMKAYIEEYNKANEERISLQEQINSETDETKKAELQKKLDASTQVCTAFAPIINELSVNISAAKAEVAAEIERGQTNQELAVNMQNEVVSLSEATQTNLDNTVITTNGEVITHTNAAAQETATLNSNATSQKLQGEQMLAASKAKGLVPGIGTAISCVDTAVAHGLITTGTAGKGSAQQLAGIIQSFGSNYASNFSGAEGLIPEINTNISSINTGVETFTAMVNTNTEEGTVILETEIPEWEQQEQEERKNIETHVA